MLEFKHDGESFAVTAVTRVPARARSLPDYKIEQIGHDYRTIVGPFRLEMSPEGPVPTVAGIDKRTAELLQKAFRLSDTASLVFDQARTLELAQVAVPAGLAKNEVHAGRTLWLVRSADAKISVFEGVKCLGSVDRFLEPDEDGAVSPVAESDRALLRAVAASLAAENAPGEN